MITLNNTGRADNELGFLSGGGEMGERIRHFDWPRNPLGPPQNWPQGLKIAVRIMLASRQPIWIGWGEELIYLYNDAYKAIIGGRHPSALGKPTTQVWPEIWEIIGPMLDTAMQGVEGTYVEEQLLIMERYGFAEETYYTYSYTPVPDGNGNTGGIICANTDDTQRVIGQRQLALLRDLGTATADLRSCKEVCERSIHALSTDLRDLPFALIYLTDADGQTFSLAAAGGIAAGSAAAPLKINRNENFAWPIAEVMESNCARVISNLNERYPGLPTAPWSRASAQAVALPISSGTLASSGALVVGLNPFRKFNRDYQSFLSLVAGQIGAAITTANTYAEEKKRAEALAQLDRAKTTFFSDVSHEFRTPLTLMLGPIEELRKRNASAETAEQLQLLHRNSLRLLKMVNSLLDFSRIESGRIQASYHPTDLSTYTAEIASTFRSTIEKAGLVFNVDCPELPEPVYVDREMWEKIVLNLLSNAFKFTFHGSITIALRWQQDRVELIVTDTGVGISEAELPRIFERFHRVRNTRSRSYEGTGIGLALVQELARLHGGNVSVNSQEGQGTSFILSIPAGTAHLPPDIQQRQPVDTQPGLHGAAFVQEASRWLDTAETVAPQSDITFLSNSAASSPRLAATPPPDAPRILLADDNADMRDYINRLLSPFYSVESVSDGQVAIERISASPPDLVLTDVMMPRVDGFGLLQFLRSDPRTRAIPFVMLSARAGEEAQIEGLGAGADAYLSKPFSARELLARVRSQLELARLRRDVEERLRRSERVQRILAEIGALSASSRGHDQLLDAILQLVGRSLGVSRCSCARVHLDQGLIVVEHDYSESHLARLDAVFNIEEDARHLKDDATQGRPTVINDLAAFPPTAAQYETIYKPLGVRSHIVIPLHRDGQWVASFWVSHHQPRDWSQDDVQLMQIVAERVWLVLEQSRSAVAIRQRTDQFETLLNQAPLGVYVLDADFRILHVNPTAFSFFGNIPNLLGRDFGEVAGRLWPTEHANEILRRFRHTLDTGEGHIVPECMEQRLDHDAQQYYEWQINRIPLPDGRCGIVCYFRDISRQVLARTRLQDAHELLASRAKQLEALVNERTAKLRETVSDLEHFSYTITHDMRAPLRAMQAFGEILREEYSSQMDETGVDFLRRIIQSATRMDALITDSLNYAKAVQTELSLEPVDSDNLLRGILESYPQFQLSRARIEVLNSLPIVLANPAGLTQCFSNILGNAVKFVAPGTLPRVTIRTEERDNSIRFWIEDNGIGIPPEQHERVFNMFQRLSKDYEGTGVGLALVRKVVEKMRGKIGLESTVGKGTRVWIELARASKRRQEPC